MSHNDRLRCWRTTPSHQQRTTTIWSFCVQLLPKCKYVVNVECLRCIHSTLRRPSSCRHIAMCNTYYMGSKPIKVKVLYERFLFDSLLAFVDGFPIAHAPVSVHILSWNLRKDCSDSIAHFPAAGNTCEMPLNTLIKHTKCTQICVNAAQHTKVNDSLC